MGNSNVSALLNLIVYMTISVMDLFELLCLMDCLLFAVLLVVGTLVNLVLLVGGWGLFALVLLFV